MLKEGNTMRCDFATLAAMLVVGIFPLSAAQAELPTLSLDALQPIDTEVIVDENVELAGCQSNGCCNYGGTKLFADIDLMFLRVTSADGLHDAGGFGGANALDWDYSFSPRVALGSLDCDGSGTRIRWWHYDDSESSANGTTADLDFFTIDAEVFQQFKIGCHSKLEVSAGVRYMDYDYFRGANDLYTYDNAFGGILGIELNHCTGPGQIYARGRYAAMVSSGILQGNGEIDRMSRNQSELALGYEVNRCIGSGMIATVGLGYEWHNWANFVGTNNTDDILTDIGLDGFAINFGLNW
jgi:hypothetical protein